MQNISLCILVEEILMTYQWYTSWQIIATHLDRVMNLVLFIQLSIVRTGMYFVVAGFLHLSLSQFLCQLIHDESSINTDVVRDSTYVEYKHELCCVGILILDKWSRCFRTRRPSIVTVCTRSNPFLISFSHDIIYMNI